MYAVVEEVKEYGLLIFVESELLGGEPCKPFLVDERLERLDRCDSDINPEIELVPIEEQRIDEVLLDDHLLRVDDILRVGDK
jgi:hypothetical protein